jgi:hypothetical protein
VRDALTVIGTEGVGIEAGKGLKGGLEQPPDEAPICAGSYGMKKTGDSQVLHAERIPGRKHVT